MKKNSISIVKKIFSVGTLAIAGLVLFAQSSLAKEPDETTSIYDDLPNSNEPDPDGSFSVLSYNIGALPEMFASFGSAGQPNGRVQKIAPKLNSFDIVGVQEQFDLIREFREGTRFPYFSKNTHLFVGGSGIDLMSKFPMSRTQRIKYRENEWYVRKGFTKNTIIIHPGVAIDVYNTHTGESFEYIDPQLEQLGQFIQNSTPKGRAVIVIGDFNSKPSHWGDIRTPVMLPNNLKDAWEVFGEDEHESMWDSPVDRILFRSGDDVEIVLDHYETIDNSPRSNARYPNYFTYNNKMLSDHPAVVGIFKFFIKPEIKEAYENLDKIYLSDMKLDYCLNGSYAHGPIGNDQSVGGGHEWDGQIQRMDPRRYQKGIGVHAPSRIVVPLNGKFDRFRADIGLDEETRSNGEVKFQIYDSNNTLLYNSGPMRPWTPTKIVDINVRGLEQIELVVDPCGSNRWDHANWANAHLTHAPQYYFTPAGE